MLILNWKLWIRTQLWQNVYADKTDVFPSDTPLDIRINLFDETASQIVTFGDYDIEIKLRAEVEMTGQVIYTDFYDQSIHIGRKSPMMQMREIYNTVSPLDLSLVTGKTGIDGNWQKFEISHEYRTLFWRYMPEDHPIVVYGDFNNLHILPATKAIRRGFDILKIGQIVRLQGFLIDWRDTGQFADYWYETARHIGQIADFKLGGQISGLCYYFYVTSLMTDGYIYQ